MNDEDFYMGKMLGDIIGSKHNQHVLMAIVGRTGSGKSSAALQIAHETAKYMSSLNGHSPDYFFNIDHVAIITEDEIVRVMRNTKKQGIYILDDIGVGYNSRLWQSKANIIMNNIIQTFRTQNNLLILTVPDPTFIDRVPRNSLRYRIDMKDANFDMGYTLGAMQELKRNYKTDKTIYPYPTANGYKYVRVEFERPPAFLIDEYEKRREEIQAQMQRDHIERLKEIFEDQTQVEKPDPFYKTHATDVFQKIEFGGLTRSELADEYQVNVKTIGAAYKAGKRMYAST